MGNINLYCDLLAFKLSIFQDRQVVTFDVLSLPHILVPSSDKLSNMIKKLLCSRLPLTLVQTGHRCSTPPAIVIPPIAGLTITLSITQLLEVTALHIFIGRFSMFLPTRSPPHILIPSLPASLKTLFPNAAVRPTVLLHCCLSCPSACLLSLQSYSVGSAVKKSLATRRL